MFNKIAPLQMRALLRISGTLLLLIVLAVLALALARPAAAAAEDGLTVAVDLLNLRAGPGLDARILRVLEAGQALTALGRSRDARWLEVRLADGAQGWVYRQFVTGGATLDQLPVTEARGGAAPAGRRYTFNMTIADNQALVTVQNFAANTPLVVSLARSDGSGALAVARGATDAAGAATFSFAMPRQWADGSPVTSGTLALKLATGDQKLTLTANVQYVGAQ